MSEDGVQRTASPAFCAMSGRFRRNSAVDRPLRARSDAIASKRAVLWNLARDGAESFNQSFALCAIVDHKRVVFAMR
jgi:hypothetical protein